MYHRAHRAHRPHGHFQNVRPRPRRPYLAIGALAGAICAGGLLAGCADTREPSRVAERPNNAPGQTPQGSYESGESGSQTNDQRSEDGRPMNHPTLAGGEMRGGDRLADQHGGQPVNPHGNQQQMPPNDAMPSQQREEPENPKVASFLGLEAPKPASWAWRPPQNAMIHTNYTVPGRDGGRSAHINVYFFGEGMGGPVQMNIDRWQQQFRSAEGYDVEPEVSEFSVNGMDVVFVELEGEWQQMGQSWYTPNQLFLAAIVEAPVGRIFIRFAGPHETVEANRETFLELVKNLEPVEEFPPAAPEEDGEGEGYGSSDDEDDYDGGGY